MSSEGQSTKKLSSIRDYYIIIAEREEKSHNRRFLATAMQE
jgi:hypothetical protein